MCLFFCLIEAMANIIPNIIVGYVSVINITAMGITFSLLFTYRETSVFLQQLIMLDLIFKMARSNIIQNSIVFESLFFAKFDKFLFFLKFPFLTK